MSNPIDDAVERFQSMAAQFMVADVGSRAELQREAIRDEFARIAFAKCLAIGTVATPATEEGYSARFPNASEVADISYAFADAMMLRRSIHYQEVADPPDLEDQCKACGYPTVMGVCKGPGGPCRGQAATVDCTVCKGTRHVSQDENAEECPACKGTGDEGVRQSLEGIV